MYTKQLPGLLGQSLYETLQLVQFPDNSYTSVKRIEAVKTLACQYYNRVYVEKMHKAQNTQVQVYDSTASKDLTAHVWFVVHPDASFVHVGDRIPLDIISQPSTMYLAFKFDA